MALSYKEIRENIARAKNRLIKNDVIPALELLERVLSSLAQIQLVHAQRVEIDVLLSDCFAELMRFPRVKDFFIERKMPVPVLKYIPGKEVPMGKALEGMRLCFVAKDEQASKEEEKASIEKIEGFLNTGKEHLRSNSVSHAVTYFKRYIAEKNKDPEAYLEIAQLLTEAEQYEAAIEMYESLIAIAPKVSIAYSDLVDIYMLLRDYEAAEKVYKKVIQLFGPHARTLLGLGKAYAEWGRTNKALEVLYQAYQTDSSIIEIKELLDVLEKR